MTDEEKQIEEMAKDVTGSIVWCSLEDDFLTVDGFRTAEDLYEAGYRKQVEGEWIETVEHKTSLLKSSIRKEKIYCCPYCGRVNRKRMNYCGHCGAKMKGSEYGS